jgi:hypothetical protein
MYAALDTATSQSELYIKRQADGAGLGTPFTEKVLTSGGLNGYTRLPSGVLIQWGIGDGLVGGTALQNTVTFATPFSGAGTYSIIFSAPWPNGGGNGTYQITPAPAAGSVVFTPRVYNGGVNAFRFNWIAIGV